MIAVIRLTVSASTLATLCSIVLLGKSSWAMGNTAGVFPPVVNEGHRSIQYRLTFDPASGAKGTRLHYQEAINGDIMLRGILHASENERGNAKFDFAQAELFWDLSEDSDKLKQGIRIDARARGRSDPTSISLNYGMQYDFNSAWQLRFAFLNTRAFGGNATDAVRLQARSQLGYRLNRAVTLNLEYYSQLGEIDRFSPWKRQKHQVGPSGNWRLANGWTLYGGILGSVNDASPDAVYRLWLTKQF